VLLAAVRLFGVNSLSGRLVELLAILSLVSIVWGNLRRSSRPASAA